MKYPHFCWLNQIAWTYPTSILYPIFGNDTGLPHLSVRFTVMVWPARVSALGWATELVDSLVNGQSIVHPVVFGDASHLRLSLLNSNTYQTYIKYHKIAKNGQHTAKLSIITLWYTNIAMDKSAFSIATSTIPVHYVKLREAPSIAENHHLSFKCIQMFKKHHHFFEVPKPKRPKHPFSGEIASPSPSEIAPCTATSNLSVHSGRCGFLEREIGESQRKKKYGP